MVNLGWVALVLVSTPIAAWAWTGRLSPWRKLAILAAYLVVASPTVGAGAVAAGLLAIPACEALLGPDPVPRLTQAVIVALTVGSGAVDAVWSDGAVASPIAGALIVAQLAHAAAALGPAGAGVARGQLVVHSDDMGMTRAVSERIGAAWRAGQLDGFSVIGNGAALAEVRAVLAADPSRPVRIAAHLNLCEGPSAADPSSVPLLVDGHGHLGNGFGGLSLRWLTSGADGRAALVDQVEREWRAQIARVAEACAPRPITAVDGHVHVHMLPFLFPVAARLARAHGIPGVRISREPFHLPPAWTDLVDPGLPINLVKHAVLRVCAVFAAPVAANEGLAAPRALIGVLFSGRMTAGAARAGCTAAVAAPGAGQIEVLFHVGRARPDVDGAWSRDVGATAFQTSPRRDVERDELARFLAELPAEVSGG